MTGGRFSCLTGAATIGSMVLKTLVEYSRIGLIFFVLLA